MMLVDPQTRFIVTNEPDAEGRLKSKAGVYVGELPPEVNIWNTNQTWAGRRWAQIMWPVPKDRSARREVLIHEQFHLVQPALGIPSRNAQNPQLDTLEGRYLMQLELRALKSALSTQDYDHQLEAIRDALLFRHRRYQLFPGAEDEETALELMEGTAAYTGVKLGTESAAAQVNYAVRKIERQSKVQTFARSFAYATGPAYGLLLDDYVSNWREMAIKRYGLAEVMSLRLHWKAPADSAQEVEIRSAAYDGKSLRASELAHEGARHAAFNKFRGFLVDGPVLRLPNAHMRTQVDPENLFQYDGLGTVYPRLRVVADWGILQVSKAALIDPEQRTVVVPAPFQARDFVISGDGWTLQLKGGWEVVLGQRIGDFQVKRTAR